MKKSTRIAALIMSLAVSLPGITIPGFAEENTVGEENTALLAEETVLPAKYTVNRLESLLPLETAKTGITTIETLGVDKTVSLSKYSGGDAASGAVIENNIYGLSTFYPDLYTSEYKYIEAVYFYASDSKTPYNGNMQFTLGYSKNVATNERSNFLSLTIPSETPVVTDKWASQVFDVSEVSENYPEFFEESFAYDHVRLRPFGSLTNSAVDNSDKIYIKELNFYKNDPRIFDKTCNVYYYPSESSARAGSDNYLYSESWNARIQNKVSSTLIGADECDSWISVEDGRKYASGQKYTYDCEADLFLYPSTANGYSGYTATYVSDSGIIDGISETVYSDISLALTSVGNNKNVIVYVSGATVLPTIVGSEDCGSIIIKGFDGTNDILEASKSGSKFLCDTVIENITIKAQSIDERWISARNCKLTIDSSCKFELSDEYTHSGTQTRTGLYVGISSSSTGYSHYSFNNPDVVYTMLAPVGGYGSSTYIADGNVVFDLNDGIYSSIYGAVRNGNPSTSNYQILNGDADFNLNGGTYKSITSNSTTGGYVNGNITFNINGGSYTSSKFIFGNSQSKGTQYSSANSVSLIVNADKLSEAGQSASALTVTENSTYASIDIGKTILIFNRTDISGVLPTSVSVPSADYFLKVNGGSAVPVFAAQNSDVPGEFLGFDIKCTNRGYAPYIGDTRLWKNKYGYYDIPETQNGQATDITFRNSLEGVYFMLHFDSNGGAGTVQSQKHEGNTVTNLPDCSFTKNGYVFAGWQYNGNMYPEGAEYTVESDAVFSAVWADPNEISTIYVDGTYGKDTNYGGSASAALKTFDAAIAKAHSISVNKIVVLSTVKSTLTAIPYSSERLYISSSDERKNYGGSLIISSPLAVMRPVTFENMGLGCDAYQHISTRSSHVIFGEGLYAAEGTNGIYLHAGAIASAVTGINTEIHSGKFAAAYFGGAYFLNDGEIAVRGDSLLTVNGAVDFSPIFGFDGYTGRNGNAVFDGSVAFIVNKGSVSKVQSTRISDITGALYVIYRSDCPVPALSSFPEASRGNYGIRIVGEGSVTPAYGADGKIIPGSIHATSSNNMLVKITNSNGFETVYPQGDIALVPGSYTAEFIETKVIASENFNVTAPMPGFYADEKLFTSSAYYARTKWYSNDSEVTKFASGNSYTVKITVYPYSYADTSSFSSATVNGNAAQVIKNANGTFTVSYSFPAIFVEYKKYVSSQNGSDSGNGSQSKPFATLSAAIKSLASTGGTIYICDKVFCDNSIPTSSKPILITSEGFKNGELVLRDNAAFPASGDVMFNNIKITMGEASHFDDRGHKIVFGDGAIIEKGKIFHVGPYAAYQNYPTIDSCDITLGASTSMSSLYVGGAYLRNSASGIKGDVKITLNGATVSYFNFGPDKYLPEHTSAYMGGNLLVTINSGSIGSIKNSKVELDVSEDTVYQFIYNNGTPDSSQGIADAVPPAKLYTIYSGVGGRVEHAYDENGNSIAGTFDIIPNEDHIAIITRNNSYTTVSYGGRYTLPAGSAVKVDYVENAYAFKNYKVDLGGGKAVYGMFSVNSEGIIHFNTSPEKSGYIFEGWYADENFTELVRDGDFIGDELVLYAKYSAFTTSTIVPKFSVRGVQMRVPLKEGDEAQGLRFITSLSNDIVDTICSFSNKNSSGLRPSLTSDSCYGTVVIPTEKLGGKALLDGGIYYYNGKNYKAKTVPAVNLYSKNAEITEYTACVVSITEDNYLRNYSVRPYIKYYTRSGNLTTVYGDEYSVSVIDTTYAILEQSAESVAVREYLRNNIMASYAERLGIEFIPSDLLEEIKEKTAQYKSNIVNSANLSLSSIKGTVYYVSPDGSDDNNGKSPSTAWKSIAKVNSNLAAGDAVLFRRDAEYRGRITARQGVTYSAYGTGAKPIINGSLRDYADPSLWTETGIENVYKLSTRINNVGIIAFDHNDIIGDYDQLVGTMRVSGVLYDGEMFINQHNLKRDLEFYSNFSNGDLYLYSSEGNPGSRFSSIEIGGYGNLLTPSSNVVVDNLTFVYGGSHGVGGGGGLATYDADGNFISIGGTKNLTVKNCIFAWVGGSILPGYNEGNTTRYGNAVEMYGSADGYTVDNCWIYQIYDTAVTHQVSAKTTGNTMQQNVTYRNNLIEYCHWSIEFYNAPCCNDHLRITRHILSENNIVRMGGYGWGSVLRPTGATLYNSFGLSRIPEQTYDFVAKNNIFFRSAGPIFRINANASEDNLEFENNLYVQDYGNHFSWYKGSHYPYDENVSSLLSGEGSQIKEVNTRGVYYYAP
ncbi:MAG: InlB B-repeat-containing protein [Clostridia bacterium]|nr:InlB B-repeat-containing protein [Clostridia bacterium]